MTEKTDSEISELTEKLWGKILEKTMIPLSCPFCGKDPEIDNYKLRGVLFWNVGCMNEDCLAAVETVDFESEEDAIKAWNQRA